MKHDYLDKLFGLSGQTAIVVGGTGVLGGALADGLAAAGAFVVVAGRNAERGEARVSAIREAGGDACFIAVNAVERKSIEGLLSTTLDTCGHVDILVNCAGVNSSIPYEEIPDDDWDRVLNTNLKSTHIGCQIFGGHMATTGGGAILNIGSVSADKPLSKVFAYSASKAAVVNYTQNVAREFATKGVRVNVLCPVFSQLNKIEKFFPLKEFHRSWGKHRWIALGTLTNSSALPFSFAARTQAASLQAQAST